MTKMIFNKNLKSLRESKNISQETLANELSVSVKTISHWETGYTEPSLSQLVHLASFFCVTLDELIISTDENAI